MKIQKISEKNKLQKLSINKNTKILTPPLKEYFHNKPIDNLHKKDTSDKIFLNSLSANIKDNIFISKNNSVFPIMVKKIKIFPKSLTDHSNSDITKKIKQKGNNNKNNEKNIILKKNIESTKKIDYRYYSIYPKKNILKFSLNQNENKEEYFWLATYDKLIKKKKLFKIFSFYNIATKASIAIGNDGIYNDFSKIKEKKMILKNYELYFIEKYNKPFIRKCDEKNLYVKLYSLSLKQINMIFSYLNRIEYKEYINNLNNLTEKDTYKKIENIDNNEENKKLNYSAIYCLGTYMNIKIYGFSRIENEDYIKDNYNIGVDNYPNSKKIAKLIKVLMINFPEYTKEHFINYIFNDSHNNELNKKMLTDKKNEINHLLISKKKSLYKCNSKNNSIIQSIVSGIPEFSFSPYFSPNTYSKNFQTNNNFKNITSNINKNNKGTISYIASCFDFTSDFFNSLIQNDETMSKALDSLRSISNPNWRNKTLFNNYNSNNNRNKKSGREKQISNFSFENDSKKNKNYIKINISNKNIDHYKNNNNKFIKKESLKNNGNNKLSFKQNNQIKLRKKMHGNINSVLKELNSYRAKFSKKSNNFSAITQSILEDNKENYNSFSNIHKSKETKHNNIVSDFTIIKVQKLLKKNKSKKLDNKNNLFIDSSSSTNKTFLKGEDIFRTTYTWNQKNLSVINKNHIQNGIRSFDYKKDRQKPTFKTSKNFSISNQSNKNRK